MTSFYDKHAEGLLAGYTYHREEYPDVLVRFYVCPRCSAMVSDWHKHEWWHRDQVKGIQNG